MIHIDTAKFVDESNYLLGNQPICMIVAAYLEAVCEPGFFVEEGQDDLFVMDTHTINFSGVVDSIGKNVVMPIMLNMETRIPCGNHYSKLEYTDEVAACEAVKTFLIDAINECNALASIEFPSMRLIITPDANQGEIEIKLLTETRLEKIIKWVRNLKADLFRRGLYLANHTEISRDYNELDTYEISIPMNDISMGAEIIPTPTEVATSIEEYTKDETYLAVSNIRKIGDMLFMYIITYEYQMRHTIKKL